MARVPRILKGCSKIGMPIRHAVDRYDHIDDESTKDMPPVGSKIELTMIKLRISLE